MASVPTTAQSPYSQPRSAWRVTLDGDDLTAILAPRLLSLRLSEKLGEEADSLEIVVHDTDGAFVPPRQGARLAVWLGWSRGTGVPIGLVDKGSFVVDEFTWSGPPDRVTITAHSADFKGSYRTRKTRSWVGQTLGAIIARIAADNALIPACHPDLADHTIPATEQHNKSDMQFIRDLGRQFDAVATVKGGALILAPRGATTTPGGKELPSLTITRQQCSSVTWRRAAREKAYDGAEAQWHDQEAGQRKTVTAGGSNRRRLKRVYPSEATAHAAAQAETGRLIRVSATVDVTLPYGDARAVPGAKVTLSGFRPHIDKEAWKISSVDYHHGANGFSAKLSLQSMY
ncbi:contractile injection system protein, VgrG/Pvc8 family [Novosphingobium capsulatum]|uniref:contractile injection system protein, VgrG/Pvc8 family n=1 Tax=Novosphingobium capsulatum TaxID=13688 RepID=UPI0007870DD4|nr:contractile injection system protein, VgrG/Pvc8 family [Novosphingobium capsulatum]WQD92567.1 contractile injection system protein, VgrG/Pvc8 family [Novosphingobium capsulatum]